MDKEGGLIGIPIQLQDCANQISEAWKFEEAFSLPKQISAQGMRSDMRGAVVSLMALVGVGLLGLGVWLWRAQDKARVVTAGFQGVSMAMVDGVSTQGGRAGNISMMAQFDKEVADQIEVAKQIVGQPLPSVGIDMGYDPKRIN